MDKTIEGAYYNDILARLEEVLLQELSWCAPWKLDFVGTDFLASKKIQGDTLEKVVDASIREMKTGGIVQEIRYKVGGKGILLKLEIDGCVHIPMEAHLKKDNIKPFMCPIANMIMDQIMNNLGYVATYLAEMDINEKTKHCVVKCAVYQNADKIGEVSDWKQA
jgi:hypothetical protein